METIDGGYVNYASSVDNKKYPIKISYKDILKPYVIEVGKMGLIPSMEDFIEGHSVKSFKTLWEMIEEYEEKEKFFELYFIEEEDILKSYLVLNGYLDELNYKIPQSEKDKNVIMLKVTKFQQLLKKSVNLILSRNEILNEIYKDKINNKMDIFTKFSNNDGVDLIEEKNSSFTYKSNKEDNPPLHVFGI